MNYRTTLQSRPGRAKSAALLLALSVIGAACGGSAALDITTDDDTTSTTEAELQDSGLPSLGDEDQNPAADDSDSFVDEESLTESEALESYFACMRDEGIDTDAIEAASFEDQEALTTTADFLAASAQCESILEDAFGDFELDPALEAALADRSAEMAACGREVLGVEIPDDVLLLDDDDPRMIEIDAIETTPEQDAALEKCAEDILGDIIDEEGNLIAPEASE